MSLFLCENMLFQPCDFVFQFFLANMAIQYIFSANNQHICLTTKTISFTTTCSFLFTDQYLYLLPLHLGVKNMFPVFQWCCITSLLLSFCAIVYICCRTKKFNLKTLTICIWRFFVFCLQVFCHCPIWSRFGFVTKILRLLLPVLFCYCVFLVLLPIFWSVIPFVDQSCL